MDNTQTIIKNIESAKRIALVLPKTPTIDHFGAAFAIESAFSPSKEILIFSSGSVPILPFLSKTPTVFPAVGSDNVLTIKIGNATAEAGELRYEKVPDGLEVYITPKTGEFKSSDVSVLPPAGNFDLIIILGAASWEELGSIYTQSPKLFFGTQTINIDINPSNEYFGTLNLVVPTVTSLCEVVVDVLETKPDFKFTEVTATCLLAGIIAGTSSFRDPKTTPSALQKASRLVSAGAEQQKIIQFLYKTKPLPLLQLWGRALARLIAVPEKQVLTAVVTKADLEKTEVKVGSLSEVLRDLVEMVSSYSLIVLLAELPNGGVQILLAGLPHEKLTDNAKIFVDQIAEVQPLTGKYESVSIHAPTTLAEVQAKLDALIAARDSVV